MKYLLFIRFLLSFPKFLFIDAAILHRVEPYMWKISYFIDQLHKMPRKNTFYVSKWIFVFMKIIVWIASMQKMYFV